MLIFAIISIPTLFVILEPNITYKKITVFFWGIVISSILCLLTWSLSTFYQFESDDILKTFIRIIFVDFIPLFVLFLYILFVRISKKDVKIVSMSFIYGFLYWSLIFSLIIDFKIFYSFTIILKPIFYGGIVIILNFLSSIKFVKRDYLVKNISFILIPFVIMLFNLVTSMSILLSFIPLIILFSFIIVVKWNIFGLRNSIILNEK